MTSRPQPEYGSARIACAWQPIETAPKDGSWILLFAWGEHHVAQWLSDQEVDLPGWFDVHSKDFLGGPDPLGWMPLPAPPRERQ